MLLPQSNIKTESYGILKSSNFGVGNVGIILGILRDKIYKNPVLAVCREYSTNARDAMRELSIIKNDPTLADIPIEVYLPNSAEPTLKIKDYGVGISPERMEDIFLKFGNSTKRNDNIQAGAYGLGAKSAFSLGNSFSVETIVDNVKYIYNAYIDETLVGKMDLIYEASTNEPNGTAIVIPVKESDFASVADTIIYCTKHWKVKPKLFGGPAERPTYPKFEELYRGTGWVLYTNEFMSACAIVDGIEYQIDKYSLSKRTQRHTSILNHGFCLEFNVGELSLTANRDHLHYDDATAQKILDKLNLVESEIKDKVLESVKDATSYIAACKIYSATIKKIPNVVDDAGNLTWNGHKLRSSLNVSTIGKWAKLLSYSIRNQEILVNRSDTRISFGDTKTLLIYNDKTNFINRHIILWLFNNNTGIDCIQVIYTPEKPSSDAYKKAVERYGTNSGDVKIEYDLELLGLLNPLKYSSINIPKIKSIVSTDGGSVIRAQVEDGNIKGYNLSVTFGERGKDRFEKDIAQFPIDDGGVFVIYDYKENTCSSHGRNVSPESFKGLVKFIGEPIIGLSARRAAMVANDPNWVPLTEAVTKKLASETILTVGQIKTIINQTHYAFKHNCRWVKLYNLTHKINDKDSTLLLWISESDKIIREAEALAHLLPAYRWLGNSIGKICSGDANPAKPLKDGLAKLMKETLDKYPFLNLNLWHNEIDNHYSNMIEYINLIDERDKNNNISATTAAVSTNVPCAITN